VVVVCWQGVLLQHWGNVRIGDKTGRDIKGLRYRIQDRIIRFRIKRKNAGNRGWRQGSLRE
jgi:hypothetical protein